MQEGTYGMSAVDPDVEAVDSEHTVTSGGPTLPPRGSKASKLWKKFSRDPPLGQKGQYSTNPFAKCLSCDASRFQPRGSAGLMKHLLKCPKSSKEDLDDAHKIAKDEGIAYEGKPEKLDGYIEASRSAEGRKRPRSASSSSLHAHFDSRPLSSVENKAASRALLLFVVMCNVSFEAVASPFFMHFIRLLRPLWHPPSEHSMILSGCIYHGSLILMHR